MPYLGSRAALATWAGLFIVATSPCAFCQDPAPTGLPFLQQIESSLEEIIDRCERSVVAITRINQPLEALANAERRTNGLVIRGGVQNGVLVPNRPLPGQVGVLQTVPTIPTPAKGAGVVIDAERRLVLTQYRVVQLGESHLVTDVEGRTYLAKIRAADPRSGLAVLELSQRYPASATVETSQTDLKIDLPELPVGKSEDLRKGRFVIAIGNPFSITTDGQPTASWGTVTNTALKAPDWENLNNIKSQLDGSFRTTLHHFGSLLQTDARLGWNASGGALVDLHGNLVGVITTASSIAGHEAPAGYAIPLNTAMRRAVETMSEGREPEYGLLGVRFSGRGATRSRVTGEVGVAASDVFPGGPAYAAGLRRNDLLLAIGNAPVRTAEALQLAVGNQPPGQTTKVDYERDGIRRQASVKLAKAYVGEGIIVTRPPQRWRGMVIDFATAIPSQTLAVKAGEGCLDPKGCVVVTDVQQQSVSWESGVRPYDFISHVGDQRVTTPTEFHAAVRGAGENVRLKFTKPLTAGQAALN